MNLVGKWDFRASKGKDLQNNFSDVVPQRGAQYSPDGLVIPLNGWAWAESYAGPNIMEKTLVSYFKFNSIPDHALQGSVITIDTINGDYFDGIVFGELGAKTWSAGSSHFIRSEKLTNPLATETEPGQLLMLAVTYRDVNGAAEMTVYRNGVKVGQYQKGKLTTWVAGNTEMNFGCRHKMGGRIQGTVDVTISAAGVYDEALSEAEIKALYSEYATGLNSVSSLDQINFDKPVYFRNRATGQYIGVDSDGNSKWLHPVDTFEARKSSQPWYFGHHTGDPANLISVRGGVDKQTRTYWNNYYKPDPAHSFISPNGRWAEADVPKGIFFVEQNAEGFFRLKFSDTNNYLEATDIPFYKCGTKVLTLENDPNKHAQQWEFLQ